MPLITWSDKLQMNIRVIDNDHMMLIDIVNALSDGLLKQADQEHIAEHLSALAHYVEDHFQREEGFLADAGYPHLDTHMKQHQKLAHTVYDLIDINRNDPQKLHKPEIQDFLKTWLTDHILKCDMHYAPYLRGNKNGSPVAKDTLKAVTVRVPPDKVGFILKCAMALSSGGADAKAVIEAVTDDKND